MLVITARKCPDACISGTAEYEDAHSQGNVDAVELNFCSSRAGERKVKKQKADKRSPPLGQLMTCHRHCLVLAIGCPALVQHIFSQVQFLARRVGLTSATH